MQTTAPIRCRAKCQWLLEHYRQQLQPDVLVICNATAQHDQTAKSKGTDELGQRDAACGGISPAGSGVGDYASRRAFTTRQNLDEAVQHLLGKPGLRWGTLQALDSHSMQRVIEWLSQATLPAQRQKRLNTLKTALRRAVGFNAQLSGTTG